MANSFSFKADISRIKNDLKKLTDDMKRELSSQTDAKTLGLELVSAMKEMIASGVSPIEGKKFQSYKASYAADIKGGKYQEYGKLRTPVNLKLSGDFLNNLTFRVVKVARGYAPSVGFFDSESKQKELGHREGHNSQKKRPIIPQSNEKIARSLMKIQLEHYKGLIAKAFKKTK